MSDPKPDPTPPADLPAPASPPPVTPASHSLETPPELYEPHPEEETLYTRHPFLLPALMIGGATLGLIVGAAFADRWKDPSFVGVRGLFVLLGDILMNTLKALVIPLIFFSVISAVSKLGGLAQARRMFGVTLAYFAITMTMAVALGLSLVNIIQPGKGQVVEFRSPEEKARAEKAKTVDSPASLRLYGVIRDMFPPNLVKAAADNSVLGIIIFALICGLLLGNMPARAAPLLNIMEILYELFLKFIFLAIWFAPIGIMGVIADRIGSLGGLEAIGGELSRLFWYAFTVVLGLFIHGVIVLPLILWLVAGRNPFRYMFNMSEALLCAFSTASSGATIPLTMRNLELRNNISKRTLGVVVPLGATVNMNGTALYEAVAVLFIAQSYGLHLDFSTQLIVLITSVLAAVGAAAIPEAGLVTMVIVLGAAKLPVEGSALVISIDWLLDRCRTTVNVWDDCVGSAVVERWGKPARPSSSAKP
jgi:solute carrier family 1 (neuronal/epithelial high affinity glutamate transporter), member 1